MDNIDDNTLMTYAQFKEIESKKNNEYAKKWYKNLSQEKKKERANKKITCATCNMLIFRTNLSNHCKTKNHIDNWNMQNPNNKLEYVKPETSGYKKRQENNTGKIHCVVCDKMVDKYYFEKHKKSKVHLKNLEKSLEKK